MDSTLNLNLPFLAAAQAQKHVTVNESLRYLDVLTHIKVIDMGINTPPATPQDGDGYVLGSAPVEDWQNQTSSLAIRIEGAWEFFTPKEGWLIWHIGKQEFLVFSQGDWATLSSSSSATNTSFLGINATADTTNRLSVSSSASLFSHEGDNHRIILNRYTSSDTASFLFQTNFKGGAEVGLTGSDALSFRVSSDGSDWKTAISIDPGTGVVSLPFTSSIGGAMRPNLLINPDFAINQRRAGNGALPSGKFFKDRWRAQGGTADMYFSGQNITINSGTIEQLIEAKGLESQALAFSIRDLSGGSIRLNIEGAQADFNPQSGWQSQTLILPASATGNLSVKLTAISSSATFRTGLKLELGNGSTGWMPVEPTIELLKCRRYFQRYGSEAGPHQTIMTGLFWNAAIAAFVIRPDVAMRSLPSVNYPAVNSIVCGNADTSSPVSGFALSGGVHNSNQAVELIATLANAVGIPGNGCRLSSNATMDGFFELDAEL